MAEANKKPSRVACNCASRCTEGKEDFRPIPSGEQGSMDYRIFFQNAESSQVSPWHSIPLARDDGMLNMVCEIPRNTRAKFEVSTSEPGNPIKQDVKNGQLRCYGIDMKWNYGMFPQTWEDPSHSSQDCGGFVGDNDPVDVVEIGDHDPKTGDHYAVKPIGALAMIDEGELDWKVVAICASDPRCALVNDVADLEVHFPGELNSIREWFRNYKTFEGKPQNKFELNEAVVGKEYTMDVISQTHGFWKHLVLSTRLQGASSKVNVGDVAIPIGCFVHMEQTSSPPLDITHVIDSVVQAMHIREGLMYLPRIDFTGGKMCYFKLCEAVKHVLSAQ